MKNQITKSVFITAIATMFCMQVHAQVKVGNNPTVIDANSAFEVESTNKGLLTPRMALTSSTASAPLTAHKAGMVVYNTATANDITPGLYYNDGVKWMKLKEASSETTTTNVVSNTINASLLGYNPTGIAANAPSSAANYGGTGISILGKNCSQWNTGAGANNHYYCFFVLSAATNWGKSYSLAKEMGGYLATITSTPELTYLNSQLAPYSGPLWLGYSWANTPGNFNVSYDSFGTRGRLGYNLDYIWITGEDWSYDWANAGSSGALVSNYPFNSGEPNNSGFIEGCVHIVPTSINSARKWNDVTCSNTSAYSVAFDKLLVEFNQ